MNSSHPFVKRIKNAVLWFRPWRTIDHRDMCIGGYRLPHGWGAVWYDDCRRLLVVAPMPLNFFFCWARRFFFWIKLPTQARAQRRIDELEAQLADARRPFAWKETELQRQIDELRGKIEFARQVHYERGRKDGEAAAQQRMDQATTEFLKTGEMSNYRNN